MPTSNEAFLDAMIRHQIGLQRVQGSIRNEVIRLLDRTEADLRREIEKRLGAAPLEGGLSLRRQRGLANAIRAIRGPAWAGATDVWLQSMEDIVRAEPEFVADAARTVGVVQYNFALPTVDTLVALVDNVPFEGRTMRQWADSIALSDQARILDEIKIGVVQGQTIQQITRRVLGTTTAGGADGATATARRQATAITRTAVTHYSNQAKRLFYDKNKDVFARELYIATLDSRTTPICASLDGETFPVGEGPIPPLHFNCRSTRVATLDANASARRPMKRATDRELLNEFTRQEGLPSVSSRGALPRGTRGSYDAFARRRVRELTGTTPARTTYEAFLKRQTVEFQNEVLGVTKARLFRRGDLSLDKFVNRQGDELTLSQLARSEKQAFRDAGLNPDDFT